MMDNRVEGVFREECGELLAHVEEVLLLAEQPNAETSREQIDDLFRSIHTIKGNSSMFGRHALAEFTHRLESLFEQIRRGELSLTQDLCSLGLESVDCMKALLDGGERAAAMSGRVSALTERIENHLGEKSSAPRNAAGVDEAAYRIKFRPYGGLFSNADYARMPSSRSSPSSAAATLPAVKSNRFHHSTPWIPPEAISSST